MRRALLYLATSCSMLLLIFTVGDWIHSINNSETFILIRAPRIYAIDNYRGEISFWAGDLRLPVPDPDGWRHEHFEPPRARKAAEFEVYNRTGDEVWFAGFAITNKRRFPAQTGTIGYSDVANVA